MNTDFLTNGDDDEVHLTKNALMNIIKEAFKEMKPTFYMYQMCIDKGLVLRTDLNLNLCNNPKCHNCIEIGNVLSDELSH